MHLFITFQEKLTIPGIWENKLQQLDFSATWSKPSNKSRLHPSRPYIYSKKPHHLSVKANGDGREGSSYLEFTEIETTTDSIDNWVIFHVTRSVIGFVLYMHQKIPSLSVRRDHLSRMREVKCGIRRLEKLVNTGGGLESVLPLIISEVFCFEEVILVLGASPIQPQHVHESCFLRGNVVAGDDGGFTKSKVAEGLQERFCESVCFVCGLIKANSKIFDNGLYFKCLSTAARALISKGAGSSSYPGPTKLFLLVKAPASFNLPLHFLPKRDFRYCKKAWIGLHK
ncbi:PREDICTED: LOW QUALITY PROTEIN: uncharacterized protein LOC105126974 [Populus euphratica]|uniref:LOW QUALITY PROTEIN: uncharacterized protein LOC105126974 n=1 Tax=Populus euphratica TaxID=75702 RepID=A0AAJ6XPL3_POPEU|nr:PREDICTED: LOW QUALITY PROTEIN: uncharacterized protein LOC105126974 [Populus euphratica]